jgi:hypothetical protein
MSNSNKIAQTAIITRLKAFSGLSALVSDRIYSDVPQDPTFPYIALDITTTPFETKDTSDDDHELIVHVFHRTNSRALVMDIQKQVDLALNRQEANITLTGGYYLTLLQRDGLTDIFKDGDGVTQHGVQNFRMLVT